MKYKLQSEQAKSMQNQGHSSRKAVQSHGTLQSKQKQIEKRKVSGQSTKGEIGSPSKENKSNS